MAAHGAKLEGVDLIPSSGGAFEVSLAGEVLYSKLKVGSFPDEQAIVDLIGEKLA